MKPVPNTLEFFAGGGMARVGLGPSWFAIYANDFDRGKADAYALAHGERPDTRDIHALTPADIPGDDPADLAWASSPCQDFSLAGARAGLSGDRSSALLGFWRLILALDAEGRAPRTIVVENVTGLLTASSGDDFTGLCSVMVDAGYRIGALELDAAAFVPQSRPRVFLLATREDPDEVHHVHGVSACTFGVSPALLAAHASLPAATRASWLWWSLPAPPRRNADLASVLLPDAAVPWWPETRTARLIAQMTPLHRARLDLALRAPGRTVAAAYRRTRGGVPRAEARFDGLAGCLRTPAGGSSRQIVLAIEDGQVRARWLAPREAARLMGLPDDHPLPEGSTAALKLLGDGVAVPVVRWLSQHLLEPLAGLRNPDAALTALAR